MANFNLQDVTCVCEDYKKFLILCESSNERSRNHINQNFFDRKNVEIFKNALDQELRNKMQTKGNFIQRSQHRKSNPTNFMKFCTNCKTAIDNYINVCNAVAPGNVSHTLFDNALHNFYQSLNQALLRYNNTEKVVHSTILGFIPTESQVARAMILNPQTGLPNWLNESYNSYNNLDLINFLVRPGELEYFCIKQGSQRTYGLRQTNNS